MKLDDITLEDAKRLIEQEKHPVNKIEYKKLYDYILSNMIFTSKKITCDIINFTKDVDYILSVHTTPINTKFTISLRFKNNNITLIRFDFGETLRHTNNYGKEDAYVVKGSHVHVLAHPSKYEIKNVIPVASIEHFKNLKIIQDVFLQVIDYINIKERSGT